MPLRAIARLIQTMLYAKRFFPYYVYNILGGIEEDGMSLFRYFLRFSFVSGELSPFFLSLKLNCALSREDTAYPASKLMHMITALFTRLSRVSLTTRG